MAEKTQSVHFGHGQISDNYVETARLQQLESLFPAAGGKHLVMLLQHVREVFIHLAHCLFVIDKQDGVQWHPFVIGKRRKELRKKLRPKFAWGVLPPGVRRIGYRSL